MFQSTGCVFGAVAEVPRLVVEDAGDLDAAAARSDADAFEDVVALVRIERAELFAEHRLVVGDERQRARAR